MSRRSRSSPATAKQMEFIQSLLRERDVPGRLRRRAGRDDLTDGDCRDLIPDLLRCPQKRRRTRGRYDREMDADYGNHEDWRDHPDAVFGDPNEHGSH